MASKGRRRAFDAAGVTELPPGPNLARIGRQKVYVTQPGFDDIGEILTSMGVEFEPFAGVFDSSLLFVNCGTSDHVESGALAQFVRDEGCVYASDHADSLIAAAFPGVFVEASRSSPSESRTVTWQPGPRRNSARNR